MIAIGWKPRGGWRLRVTPIEAKTNGKHGVS